MRADAGVCGAGHARRADGPPGVKQLGHEDAPAAAPVSRHATATVTVQAKRVPANRPPVSSGGNAAVRRLVAGGVGGDPAGGGVGLPLLSAGGGGALGRFGVGGPQRKLSVSQPGDPMEREADAMAARVSAGPGAYQPTRTLTAARAPVAPAADGTAGDGTGPDISPALESLIREPGAGEPLPPDVRDRIESHLGVPLGGVQLHTGPAAQEAAAQLGARAFTFGNHIFLGPGESPHDVALMAHEATHVVQQQAVNVYRDLVHRSSDSLLPDFIVDAVRTYARDLPGYDMLTVVAGYDPIDDRTVERSPENLVRGVIGLVPFGNHIADQLLELEILQDAFALVDQGLTEHNLTLARISADIDRAWDELDVLEGFDGNAAIIARYVGAIYADALAFARSLVDTVLRLIREAAVGLAETYLADTPVWALATKVIHHDPLRGTPVEATTVEILGDFLTLIGKQDTLDQMRERGTLQRTADWLDTQIARFLSLISELGALFEAGWAAIQPENIANLPQNLERLARDAIGLVRRVGAFATDVIAAVLRIIKDALLGWLSGEAHKLPGFRLLTVILGENPFTHETVPRTAANLIGGFIALLPNGEATYQQLAEAGVIAEAGTRIEGAMSRLGISLDLITNTFLGVWNSLTLEDLLNPIAAFVRVLERFGEPLTRIVEFVVEVMKVVIELILRLMNFPSDLLGSIVSNAMQAIDDIQRDPVGFLVNMLSALKAGLAGFFDHVLSYLLDGLASWLFRGLGQLGITRPPDYSLRSILELVLQVLGITGELLWRKLGEQIGEENVAKIRGAIDTLTGVWSFIKDVQEGGVAAIWRHVENQLGNLWDTLLNMAKDWIVTQIVEKVTAKLLSMLDPTGIMAVVNSMIAFFNAIQSAIEYLRDILEIVNDYVTTIAAVAAGNIAPGAAKVERGLANAIPVAIGFLANQVGLGNVPEKVVEIIQGLRELVDQALTWLFEQAKRLGQAALAALGIGPAGATDPQQPETAQLRENFTVDGEPHSIYAGPGGALMLASDPQPVSNVDRLRDLYIEYRGLPPTGADADRRRVVHQMVELVKSDPSLLGGFAGATPEERADILVVQALMGTRVMVRARTNNMEYPATVDGIDTREGIAPRYWVRCRFDTGIESRHRNNPGSEPERLIPLREFVQSMSGAYTVVKPFTGGNHGSRYAQVEGNGYSLLPELCRGGRWRRVFYPTDYTAAVEAHLARVVAESTPAEDLTKPPEERRWMWRGSYYVNRPDGPGEATVDHTPAVVVHFKTEGVNMTQPERRDWYRTGGDSELPEIMPRGRNSSKGSEDERLADPQMIGERFRGPGE
ncbi:eCIS core domain-containing protein [Plantactinospora sonchi]|uniref:DUF4157 domain-containing protein n=1 Tax=Plantactinospora sonchi TaxID=1544735 RepID=A0ABU7RRU1_9ACTN